MSLVLGHLAEGWTAGEIVDNFPGLVVDGVRACVAYVARLTDVRFSDVEVAWDSSSTSTSVGEGIVSLSLPHARLGLQWNRPSVPWRQGA